MLRSVANFCHEFSHTSFCQCCSLLQPEQLGSEGAVGKEESGNGGAADVACDYYGSEETDSKKVARQESLESTNRTVARALFNVAHLFDYSNRRVSTVFENYSKCCI